MAINDIYSLIVKGQIHGQTTMNVLHYRVSVDGDSDDADGLVPAFRAMCENEWLACCSGEWAITGYICQKIHPLPVLSAFSLDTDFLEGTVVGDALPSSMAAVLTKRTSIGGRVGRGRLYLAGVPTSFEVDSLLTAGALQTYQALANKLDNTITTAILGEYVPCLWHRASRTNHTVNSFLPRQVLRNQRRRQVGRGI